MNYIAGSDRGEALLLPEVLDDYVAPENPVRFIDAFVGQLDLGKAGFSNAQLQETGRPQYDPGDLAWLDLGAAERRKSNFFPAVAVIFSQGRACCERTRSARCLSLSGEQLIPAMS